MFAPFGFVLGLESPKRENAKRSVEPSRARGVPSGAPAQTAERGRGARPRSLTRLYWIAVWGLSLVLPLLRCCFSWYWRSGSPCSCCPRCSCLSCRACSSRFERASRSTIARFYVGATNRPKSGPRGAQEAPRAPRGRQETPRQRREAPRERQEAPRRAQERFGSHLGSILDPPGR